MGVGMRQIGKTVRSNANEEAMLKNKHPAGLSIRLLSLSFSLRQTTLALSLGRIGLKNIRSMFGGHVGAIKVT